MTPEMWTIISVGIALAGLSLAGQQSSRRERAAIRTEIAAVHTDFGNQIAGLRAEFGKQVAELRTEIAALRAELAALRERMAHMEGLIDGLREAVTHNRAA